jgi:aminopeptidase N
MIERIKFDKLLGDQEEIRKQRIIHAAEVIAGLVSLALIYKELRKRAPKQSLAELDGELENIKNRENEALDNLSAEEREIARELADKQIEKTVNNSTSESQHG